MFLYINVNHWFYLLDNCSVLTCVPSLEGTHHHTITQSHPHQQNLIIIPTKQLYHHHHHSTSIPGSQVAGFPQIKPVRGRGHNQTRDLWMKMQFFNVLLSLVAKQHLWWNVIHAFHRLMPGFFLVLFQTHVPHDARVVTGTGGKHTVLGAAPFNAGHGCSMKLKMSHWTFLFKFTQIPNFKTTVVAPTGQQKTHQWVPTNYTYRNKQTNTDTESKK